MIKSFFNPKFISIILVAMLAFSSWLPTSALARNTDEELFFIAQRAFEDGFYDVSIRYIDQLLAKNPQAERRIQAKLLLGQCYFFNSQYLKAFEIFQRLLNTSRFQDAVLFWLAETHLKIKDYSQAKNHYKKLLESYPESDYMPQAYYALGWIDFEQTQYEEAKKIFLDLVDRFPEHPLVEEARFLSSECQFFMAQYKESISSFNEYLDLFKESSRRDQIYFYKGEAYYYLEDYEKAISFYTNAYELTVNNQTKIMANIGKGWSYVKLKEFTKAEKAFQYALDIALSSGAKQEDAILGLAGLFTESNDLEKSLEYYGKFLERYPNHPRVKEIYLSKANLFYTLESFNDAVSIYQDIIEMHPSDAPLEDILEKAYLGLGWTFMRLGDLSKAIEVFQHISQHSKNKATKVSALAQIGDAYQDLNEFQNAISAYDEILKNFPNTPYTDYVQYRQGIALLKMGKIQSARLSFQSLQENFPRSRYLLDIDYYIGMAYFKKNDFISAKENLTRFIDALDPQHEFQPEAHFVLGLCYFYLNQYKDAIAIFQKIKRTYPREIDLIAEVDFHIARSLYQSGDVRNALREFKIIAFKYAKTKISLESLLWLGEYYSKTFDFNNAILFYEQIIDHFPNSPEKGKALLNLGQAYFEQKDFDRALNQFKQIDERFSSDVIAKAKLSIANTFAQQLDPATALKTYETIIENSPEFKKNAYVKIAQLFFDKKDYSSALKYYEKALAAPESPEEIKKSKIHFLIGDIYEILNQNEKAIEEYLKIPYLYPFDTKWIIKAYLRLAKIFENAENWNNAINVYNQILVYEVDERTFAQERLEWIAQNVPSN